MRANQLGRCRRRLRRADAPSRASSAPDPCVVIVVMFRSCRLNDCVELGETEWRTSRRRRYARCTITRSVELIGGGRVGLVGRDGERTADHSAGERRRLTRQRGRTLARTNGSDKNWTDRAAWVRGAKMQAERNPRSLSHSAPLIHRCDRCRDGLSMPVFSKYSTAALEARRCRKAVSRRSQMVHPTPEL